MCFPSGCRLTGIYIHGMRHFRSPKVEGDPPVDSGVFGKFRQRTLLLYQGFDSGFVQTDAVIFIFKVPSGRELNPRYRSINPLFTKTILQLLLTPLCIFQGTFSRQDSNLRPPDPKSGAIPNLATKELLLVPLFCDGFHGDGQPLAVRTTGLRSRSTASRHHETVALAP